MKFQVNKAVREKIYAKIALFSPSGGGKTYSALRLAKGMIKQIEKMTGQKKQIWLANNEGSRGKYYANEFSYEIIELVAPHSPETYKDLIEFAEKSDKCAVLIIDSLSKEWAGEGGVLDLASSMGGTFQTAWKKVSPRHRQLMEKLVESNLHIIATMRGEDQYESYQDEKTGKNKVEKIGVGAKQGKDFEYEFTLTLSLDQKTNSAETFKDNTHLFESRNVSRLTEEDGENIIVWANQSQIEPEKPKPDEIADGDKPQTENLTSIMTDIVKIVEEIKAKGIDKSDIGTAIKKHVVDGKGKATANFNLITDIKVGKSVRDELKKLGGL